MSAKETQNIQDTNHQQLFKYPIFKTIKELLNEIENLEVKEELKK